MMVQLVLIPNKRREPTVGYPRSLIISVLSTATVNPTHHNNSLKYISKVILKK